MAPGEHCRVSRVSAGHPARGQGGLGSSPKLDLFSKFVVSHLLSVGKHVHQDDPPQWGGRPLDFLG